MTWIALWSLAVLAHYSCNDSNNQSVNQLSNLAVCECGGGQNVHCVRKLNCTQNLLLTYLFTEFNI